VQIARDQIQPGVSHCAAIQDQLFQLAQANNVLEPFVCDAAMTQVERVQIRQCCNPFQARQVLKPTQFKNLQFTQFLSNVTCVNVGQVSAAARQVKRFKLFAPSNGLQRAQGSDDVSKPQVFERERVPKQQRNGAFHVCRVAVDRECKQTCARQAEVTRLWLISTWCPTDSVNVHAHCHQITNVCFKRQQSQHPLVSCCAAKLLVHKLQVSPIFQV